MTTPAAVQRDPRGPVRAVVVILPGGQADSLEHSSSRQLAVLRMLPFARELRRRGARHGLAVWQVRYRYRGWNGVEASPLQDVRHVLSEIRRRHPGVPVTLLGHSMGGRVAVRAAGEANVCGVVALAPWLPEGEPVAQLADRRVLIAHGTADTVTSPQQTRLFAERAATVTENLRYVEVAGGDHAMLRRCRTWHRLATDFVLGGA